MLQPCVMCLTSGVQKSSSYVVVGGQAMVSTCKMIWRALVDYTDTLQIISSLLRNILLQIWEQQMALVRRIRIKTILTPSDDESSFVTDTVARPSCEWINTTCTTTAYVNDGGV